MILELDILRLPSLALVQTKLGKETKSPGIHKEDVYKQFKLYKEYEEQRKKEGKLEPLGLGLLLFDEAKASVLQLLY